MSRAFESQFVGFAFAIAIGRCEEVQYPCMYPSFREHMIHWNQNTVKPVIYDHLLSCKIMLFTTCGRALEVLVEKIRG